MRIKLFLIMLLVFASSTPTWSAELNGKQFAEDYQNGGAVLKLRGLGVKTYFFIKVFVAGFYLGDKVEVTQILNDVPRRIEVAYFQPVPARKLAHETRRRIILNTTNDEYLKIKSRVDEMEAYFVELHPGDRYSLTYLPGRGTEFTYNNKIVGVIEGADFARALFSVWIGNEPLDQRLKMRLLGLTDRQEEQVEVKKL